MAKKHLLYITNSAFWRPSNGKWMRVQALIQFLAPRVRLDILYLGAVTETDVAAIRAVKLTFRFQALPGARVTGYEKLSQAIRTVAPQLCLIEAIQMADVAAAVPEGMPTLLDSHDLLSRRTRTMAAIGLEFADSIDEATEMAILKRFDGVVCIQQDEHATVSQWLGSDRAILAPHPCAPIPLPSRDSVTRIGMIASRFHANVDGLNHFLGNIWPLVQAKHLELLVFGKVVDGFAAIRMKRIHFIGFRESLEECYRAVDIVINPVRYGSGLKIKSVEALAFGRPLVTTPEGASGLACLDGKALRIARTDEDFAAAIDGLVSDAPLRHTMIREGLAYVASHLTPEACFNGLLAKIESLA